MSLKPAQMEAIEAQRQESQATRRAVVPALEEILYQPLPVLDKGFIRVVDYMGDDAAIVQAARVSYGKGTRGVSTDQALIAYLMRHRHTSPFEMCELKLHVKLPIFVARQWVRHRTASLNEYSARYSVLEEEFYLPDPEQLAAQASSNRQGRGEALPAAVADAMRDRLATADREAYARYLELLNADGEGRPVDPSKPGLARELARITLPLSTYSEWYWKIDLHNLLHFTGLRADRHAQLEIRAYALVLLEILRRWVPLATAAFEEHRLNAATFSATALAVLRRMLAGEQVTQASSGLGPREWRELNETLAAAAPERAGEGAG